MIFCDILSAGLVPGGPGPPPRGPPPVAAGGGPPERNEIKIADFVKDSSKNSKFSGALCARIVTFLNFCHGRAPVFHELEIWTKH